MESPDKNKLFLPLRQGSELRVEYSKPHVLSVTPLRLIRAQTIKPGVVLDMLDPEPGLSAGAYESDE